MSDPDANAPFTLGQRIDALLGPLEEEAEQYREAIAVGREQIEQMQSKLGLAEEALGNIERQMVQVLHAIAAEEPIFALAMGGGAEADALPPGFGPEPEALAATPQDEAPAGEPVDALAVPSEQEAQAVAEISGLLDDAPDASSDTAPSLDDAVANAAEVAQSLRDGG